MICFDWWAFELMALISGYMGVTNQSASVVLMNIQILIYHVGKGFDVVSCSIIGQQIGDGNVAAAKLYYNTF